MHENSEQITSKLLHQGLWQSAVLLIRNGGNVVMEPKRTLSFSFVPSIIVGQCPRQPSPFYHSSPEGRRRGRWFPCATDSGKVK